jgi:hypothetical protein
VYRKQAICFGGFCEEPSTANCYKNKKFSSWFS